MWQIYEQLTQQGPSPDIQTFSILCGEFLLDIEKSQKIRMDMIRLNATFGMNPL